MASNTDQAPVQLMPRRNPGIIERFTAVFFRREPGYGPQPDQEQTSQTGVVSDIAQLAHAKYFVIDQDRQSIYRDADELDRSDEEVSSTLDTIADNATTSENGLQVSFTVETKDAKFKAMAEGINKVTKLHTNIYSMARMAIKYGDLFTEVVIDGTGHIVALKTLPAITMVRNEDAQGNLLAGKPVYDQYGSPLNLKGVCAYDQIDPDSGQLLASFLPWQIIHGRWNWDGTSLYGTSMLRVTRGTAKKLKAVEESLVMGRLIRALLKLAFYVDTTGLDPQKRELAMTAFKQNITTKQYGGGRIENPFFVNTDFFVSDGHYRIGQEVRPSRTRIEAIDPKNDGLVAIDDIKYLQRKKLSTLRVPPAYLGFEEDVNAKSTLTSQDVQYVRYLRRLQQFLGQHVEMIYKIGAILEGVVIDDQDYDLEWPTASTADEAAESEAFLKKSQGFRELLDRQNDFENPVIDVKFVAQDLFGLDDDEYDEIEKRINKARDEQVTRELKILEKGVEAGLRKEVAGSAPKHLPGAPAQSDPATPAPKAPAKPKAA